MSRAGSLLFVRASQCLISGPEPNEYTQLMMCMERVDVRYWSLVAVLVVVGAACVAFGLVAVEVVLFE